MNREEAEQIIKSAREKGETPDLSGADLRGANLRWADLRWADLRWADLRGAALRWAALRWADLSGADLSGADLSGADLRGADLRGADLRGADIARITGLSPTMVLLADWGELSRALTVESMFFDASNHPNPVRFDKWKAGGLCPYDGETWQRCINFKEDKKLWPGWNPEREIWSALKLAQAILAEKCKNKIEGSA